MTKHELKLYQEAKKTGDTDILLLEEIRKSKDVLSTIQEELKKKLETEVTIDIPRDELKGADGLPGEPGARGGRFLGTFATPEQLPHDTVEGDFAYVDSTGELWYVAADQA